MLDTFSKVLAKMVTQLGNHMALGFCCLLMKYGCFATVLVWNPSLNEKMNNVDWVHRIIPYSFRE